MVERSLMVKPIYFCVQTNQKINEKLIFELMERRVR